jgi:hypothetical protein
MNANYSTPARARIAAFIGAVLTSTVVLGSTVAGMQPQGEDGANLAARERVMVSAASSTTTAR